MPHTRAHGGHEPTGVKVTRSGLLGVAHGTVPSPPKGVKAIPRDADSDAGRWSVERFSIDPRGGIAGVDTLHSFGNEELPLTDAGAVACPLV